MTDEAKEWLSGCRPVSIRRPGRDRSAELSKGISRTPFPKYLISRHGEKYRADSRNRWRRRISWLFEPTGALRRSIRGSLITRISDANGPASGLQV